MTSTPPSVAIVSLGCPKNLVDSEKLLADLAEGGLLVGAPIDDADVIVVNTCGFLAAARDESLAMVREAVEQKRSGRARRVVVAGCLPSHDGAALLDAEPGIDAVIGVNDRDAILAAVTGAGRHVALAACDGSIATDAGRFRLTPRHTAYLRIAEGCSQKCAFCTIPAIRGPFRSKTVETVLAEARELIADGAVELNVIAQDTTAYGRDLAPPTELADLLRRLDELDGVEWIRLLYTYPNRFTDELVAALAETAHVVPYVDVPLQHVATSVLKRMCRGTTRRRIDELLADLRGRVGGIVLRTTFIVGFPGETDAEFAELLDFVRETRFEAMGVFEYSPEPGTPAADMPDQVPDDIKAARAERLMLAQQSIALAANRRLVGHFVEVLVDGVDGDGQTVGRHFGQAPDIDGVCLLTAPIEPGAFVLGRVIDADPYDLVVAVDD